MEKTYCEFLEEITAEELYEGLLGYGMFANKLPPIFSSESFLKYCNTVSPSFSDKEWHDCVSYNFMRNNNIPRLFGIPTPMKYQRLCAILRDNWEAIKRHFHDQADILEYRVSRIHLRKLYGKKELFEMNYKNWREDGNPETDLLFSKTDYGVSKYMVKADISTCFPSIYSHALPWALVGKETAKATCRKKKLWYNRIDAACSTLKNGETHGLLIGPYASNLLSEIILTKVDKILYEKGYRYTRNIDDYECFVESYEKAQWFLRDLEEALREYDLSLNHKKTSINNLPVAIAEKWVHKLNSAINASKDTITYPEVNSYLDLALNLATQNGNSAVLCYAVKSLSSRTLTVTAKRLLAQRIMHMAVVYPYLIQLLEEYVFNPLCVKESQIKTFSDALYLESKSSHNYEGVCYAIYFSLKYGFTLNDLDIAWVIERKDCIMSLMTWLYYLKCNHGKRNATELKPLKNEAKRLSDTEMDRYWLFCYEVLSQDDLKGDWKGMKKAKVSFLKSIK